MFFPRRPMPPVYPNRVFGSPFGMTNTQLPTTARVGLIQRLFSKTNALKGMANPQMLANMNPTTLQGLTNPANLASIMGNIQKTLNMAESAMPMIQQYGPLVKNAPALWKLYKELKNTGDSDAELKKKETETSTAKKQPKKRTLPTVSDTEQKVTERKSIPKLYI